MLDNQQLLKKDNEQRRIEWNLKLSVVVVVAAVIYFFFTNFIIEILPEDGKGPHRQRRPTVTGFY